MALRDHQIIEWIGSVAEGNATVRCNCGWSHTGESSDASLAAYRFHKSTN